MNSISPICFHSCFSFGIGGIPPVKMATELYRIGVKSFTLTDQASFAGLFHGKSAAQAHNLTYLAGQSFVWAPHKKVLLFPDDQGSFAWINRLASSFDSDKSTSGLWLEEFLKKRTPTGHGRAVFIGFTDEIIAKVFRECHWQVFFAIQNGNSIAFIKHQLEHAGNVGAKVILTPEVFCAQKEDYHVIRMLRAIHQNTLSENLNNFALLLPIELAGYKDLAEKFPQAMANNHEFCEQPTWMPDPSLKMPAFSSTNAESISILSSLAMEGIKKRYSVITNPISERFSKEMNTIAKMGFSDYFLVVNDITQKARELGHRVLGRGSAANSLISYALDFTQVDPIKHNLYFERFLNEFRSSPPDIDLDFSWRIRDKIYAYLLERWGSENVALIGTHISLRGRSAIRETGKALGYTEESISFATSIIGGSTLKQFIENPEEFCRYNAPEEKIKAVLPLIKMAAGIEGIPRHFSIHAGGVIICPQSIYNFTPTFSGSKVLPVTQLEMHGIEKAGLVKLDLLSQRSLGVYSDMMSFLACKSAATTKIPGNPEEMAADTAVAKALKNGETIGVFYIESPGMRGLLKKMSCQTYNELVAASSIIRPGVAESGMMQEFLRRHLQPSARKSIHPALDELMQETYGVMVYQEDVIKVAHHLAGFSLGEADLLRRAMSGKERGNDRMLQARDKFLCGAEKKGLSKAQASEIWRQISSFCGYAFCKAHSASYAVLSLELLWLKMHFPKEFMAAVINNRGGFYSIQAYVSESVRLGVEVFPPEISLSQREFSVENNGIRTGLEFVSSLKSDTISRILHQRSVSAFKDFSDFMERIRPDENEVENLIDSGALNQWGNPAALRWQFRLQRGASLFSQPAYYMQSLPTSPLSLRQILIAESRALGFCVSGHPTLLLPDEKGIVCSKTVENFVNRKIRVRGLLIAAKSVTTSSGRAMKFFTLEDRHGLIEVVMFPEAWKKNAVPLDRFAFFEIAGVVKKDNSTIALHGERLRLLTPPPVP